MDLVLLAVAAVWGGVTGLLIPRAAYRFAVEPEEPWRTACPAGHAFTGPLGGWLGPARCAACGSRAQTAVPPSGEKAEAPVPPYADERTAPVSPSGDGAEAPALPYGDDRPAPAPYAPGTLAPLVTVLACTVLAAATGARPELAGWLLLAPVAVLLATVDRRVHRLPDPLTLPWPPRPSCCWEGPPCSPATPDPGPPRCSAVWRSAASTSCSSSSTPTAWASAM